MLGGQPLPKSPPASLTVLFFCVPVSSPSSPQAVLAEGRGWLALGLLSQHMMTIIMTFMEGQLQAMPM